MDMIGPIIVGVLIGIITIIGSSRKASQALQNKPKDTVMFSTSASMQDVFQIVQDYAKQAKMEVEDVNKTEGRIVLGQNTRGFHNGFWLAIYVQEHPGIPTHVEIGIKSKTMQMSPVLTRIRNKAVEELKSKMNVV
ncbi:MAG TPA: hypothetical protein VFB21_10580 [Chthonomonadaceae bacterium]|nr:hypothetical protein [Chthonomonadaceae bacterium]